MNKGMGFRLIKACHEMVHIRVERTEGICGATFLIFLLRGWPRLCPDSLLLKREFARSGGAPQDFYEQLRDECGPFDLITTWDMTLNGKNHPPLHMY